MRLHVVFFTLAFAFAPLARAAQPPTPAANSTKAAQDSSVPPLSYTCTMDTDVVTDKPGNCPKCGMKLVPVRLDSIWTCPVHAIIHESKPGKCPIDHRDLIQVTVGVTFTCPGTSIDSIDPGKCPDGSPMVKKYTPRPHGNHNPQHGGQFFMAPDNWHHLEGTYPSAGVFRMYFYDDYTRPLKLSLVKDLRAQVVIQRVDPKTHVATPGQSFPLTMARGGRYLEAKIGKTPLPANLEAKVRFQPEAPEHVFDFSFDKYSKDAPAPAAPSLTSAAPAAPKAAPTSAPAVASAASASAPAAPGAPAAATAAPVSPAPATTAAAPAFGGGSAPNPIGVDPGLITLPIPDNVPEMLAQLRTRTQQIKTFIDNGQFADIYVPAFQAKDLAVALEGHQDTLSPDERRIAEPALERLVRSAYLLDAFGDIGNKLQISQAYDRFSAAAKDIDAAFPKEP